MMSFARPIAVATAALTTAAFLDLQLAEHLLSRPFDVSYVPSGKAMRLSSLGHRTFLSDLYWLETVQYVGEPKADQRGWEKLFPLVDLVTDLDPRHGYAYQTAGIVLSAAGRLEESNRILEKGMAQGPPYWTFPYYLSFNHWFYLGDYEKGAHYARLAATVPGASPNVAQLALALSSKSGTPDDALAVLEDLRATVQDEVTRSRLEEQMKLAILERDAQRLEQAVERFRGAHGRDPFSLEELVITGLIAAIPADPFGGEYRWEREKRKVRSSKNPFRFSPPEGSQQGGFPQPSAGELRRHPE